MKILFICASLEAGCDGVGDYTRRLAGECAARGHQCAIVALHDAYVTGLTDEPGSVPLRRLSTALPWSDRLTRTESYAEALSPDWISWQFVAYGYSPKGIVPSALLELAGRLRGPRGHLMLHELWIGLEKGSASWARLNGSVQRHAVLRFIRRVDADIVHTSNQAYLLALQQERVPVTILTLFGNVPVTDQMPPTAPALAHWLCGRDASRSSALVAMTFGTLHPQWQPESTASWLARTAADHGKRPVALLVGRSGRNAPAVIASFQRQGIEASIVGEQDAPTVSSLLRHSDFGIAAHPWALVGKSGAVAAMLEHGLPVVVPRDDWQLRGVPDSASETFDPLLAPMTALDSRRTSHWLAARRPPASLLPRVAATFLGQLAPPASA